MQAQNSMAAVNVIGPSKEVEGAMELALIRPDLVTEKQVQLIAQELKNRLKVQVPYFAALQGQQAQAQIGGNLGNLVGRGQNSACNDPAGVVYVNR